ncbi:MAG: lytic murein transglycosylase [Desulforhabdus sp.]|jgi:membrane-bound lytic murein transglycosylase B|nr:lytic murein transglycosylase [Desulforhabdus sp.]
MAYLLRIFCFVLLWIFSLAGISTALTPAERFTRSVDAYGDGKKDLAKLHPQEFNQLHQKVKKHLSRGKLRRILSKRAASELDDFHMERILFIASPKSVSIQRQQHIDWVPKLVNDETISKGVLFFQRYSASFKLTYEKTGVKPQDILAILNWESKLGEQRGQYNVLKIFVGQAFYLDEVETDLYRSGAYDQEGVMPRQEALQRIQRLKKRALNNLAELLIQAEQQGFDPFKVKGSWAGAIGIPQFMPASMVYAVDGNGDGIIDLNTVEDSILSVANYLKKNGYHSKGARYAFKRYNSEEMYMRGVALYSQEAQKRGVGPAPGWVYGKRK